MFTGIIQFNCSNDKYLGDHIDNFALLLCKDFPFNKNNMISYKLKFLKNRRFIIDKFEYLHT